MRFRVNKLKVEQLLSMFSKTPDTNAFEEIELEAVMETATQAIYEQQLKSEAWHKGYHVGLKEGLYKGRYPKMCACGCNCQIGCCGDWCR